MARPSRRGVRGTAGVVPRRIGAGGGVGAGEELLGQREQDARAVAGLGVGGDRAAVPEALQPTEGRVEYGLALALDVGHEADAAGVALVAAPVVQEVVRHLASERIAGAAAGPRRTSMSRDTENGAAWGERRCSSSYERTEVAPGRQHRRDRRLGVRYG